LLQLTRMEPAAQASRLAGDDVEYTAFDPGHAANRAMLSIGEGLRLYHRHSVRGLGHLAAALAQERPVVLVGNHCLDVVDPLMLNVAVYQEVGRPLRFIGHGSVFFETPLVRELAPIWGLIPNRHMALADTVLARERVLVLYPGSGAEAILRSYWREPYRLKWYGRVGFVELAARHRATLLFVAGLGIDELYYQTDLRIPAAVMRILNAGDAEYYHGARLQLGALGPHVVPAVFPLPVRVTHVISPPLGLSADLDPDDEVAVRRTQVRLWAECQSFLDRAIAARDRDSDTLDRIVRTTMYWMHRLGL